MKRSKGWKVLCALLAALLPVLSCGTDLAMAHYGDINKFLGTTGTILQEGSLSKDTQYYPSGYGELSEENLEKVISDAYEQIRQEAREGSVLLHNPEGALPLGDEERRITLLGYASAHPLYVGGGVVTNQYRFPQLVTDYREAFEGAGFTVNPAVYDAIAETQITAQSPTDVFGNRSGDLVMAELDASFYTPALQKTWESDYRDACIVILSRYAGEGANFLVEMTDESGRTITQLSLTKKERYLLSLATTSFEKVIVLLNCPWPMEVEEILGYGVDALMWIGTPGASGLEGVVDLLTGKECPSGRLVDTFAASSLSSPAVASAAGNTPFWNNAQEVEKAIWGPNPYEGFVTSSPAQVTAVSVQQESIYIGYRYYETRYEDLILGRGNAGGSACSFASGEGGWDYAKEVTYPFAYGLSYTSFDQKITGVDYDKETDHYLVHVSITNTGSVPGRYAVPVYVQTPYGDYERKFGVEKAAISLVGFEKTDLLEPGETQELTVEVDRYLLASYDAKGAKGYIVSEGDTTFAIGSDAHAALNHILAAKGATGLYDQDGNPFEGDPSCTWQLSLPFDDHSYATSENGTRVTNRFEDKDIHFWLKEETQGKEGQEQSADSKDPLPYLTREDWEGTFPTSPASVLCTQEMMDLLNCYTPETSLYQRNQGEETEGASEGNSERNSEEKAAGKKADSLEESAKKTCPGKLPSIRTNPFPPSA